MDDGGEKSVYLMYDDSDVEAVAVIDRHLSENFDFDVWQLPLDDEEHKE